MPIFPRLPPLLVSLSGCLLVFPLLPACSRNPHPHLTPPQTTHALPKEDPKTVLKQILTEGSTGKTDALLAHTAFASNDQKTLVKHLIPQAATLRELQHALVDTFGNAGTFDDPLPALLAAVDNATVRFEPDTARIIPPPPNSPFTLLAVNHHWKLDYARTQNAPDQPLSPEALHAIDDQTTRFRRLAKDIRNHQYPTLDTALTAINPSHHPAATQPTTLPTSH